MASIPMVLHQIRRARRRAERPPNVGDYRQYQGEYRVILRAVKDSAGEKPMAELGEWAAAKTQRDQRLPPPAALRARARQVLDDRGIEVPPALRGSS